MSETTGGNEKFPWMALNSLLLFFSGYNMFGGGSRKMDDLMINLKMGSKSMEREAHKCEKETKAYRAKVKKALEEQNKEIAQVHAETAIRKKNERKYLFIVFSRSRARSHDISLGRRNQFKYKVTGA